MYNSKNIKQGKYKIQNPSKYKGNVDNIIFRSSLEFKYFRYCDINKNIIQWNSEEVVVPYISPIDKKLHRYFLDLWVKTKNQEFLIEIKPLKFTKQPVRPKKRNSVSYQIQLKNFIVNKSKWDRAKIYAESKGMKFQILTEKDI